MTRYIDADVYIKYCEDKWIPLNVDAVTEQPTADVVEVVRCENCKWWDGEKRNGFYYFETCSKTGLDSMSYDYCSHAERRK